MLIFVVVVRVVIVVDIDVDFDVCIGRILHFLLLNVSTLTHVEVRFGKNCIIDYVSTIRDVKRIACAVLALSCPLNWLL